MPKPPLGYTHHFDDEYRNITTKMIPLNNYGLSLTKITTFNSHPCTYKHEKLHTLSNV